MVKLKIYWIIKQIFAQEFEKGIEVVIPAELRQDDLNMNVRYYDPVLSIISMNLTSFRRQTFHLKK